MRWRRRRRTRSAGASRRTRGAGATWWSTRSTPGRSGSTPVARTNAADQGRLEVALERGRLLVAAEHVEEHGEPNHRGGAACGHHDCDGRTCYPGRQGREHYSVQQNRQVRKPDRERQDAERASRKGARVARSEDEERDTDEREQDLVGSFDP